jgi:hypothetical protein
MAENKITGENHMSVQHSRRWLWIEWTLATWVGYTLGVLAILPWMVQLAYAAQPGLLTGLAGGAILGGLVGGAQWFSLRRHVKGVVGWWLLASIAGGMLGLALGMALADMLTFPAATGMTREAAARIIPLATTLRTALTGAVVGLVFGGAQWLVLRRYLQTSGWWVIASGLGWMIGMGLGALLAEMAGVIVALLITSLISGVITGLVLQRLVQRPQQA